MVTKALTIASATADNRTVSGHGATGTVVVSVRDVEVASRAHRQANWAIQLRADSRSTITAVATGAVSGGGADGAAGDRDQADAAVIEIRDIQVVP